MTEQFDDSLLKTVKSIAYGYRSVIDDAFSVACLGLVERLHLYDKTKSSFRTWVIANTHYSLWDEIRKIKRELKGNAVFTMGRSFLKNIPANTNIENEFLDQERRYYLHKALSQMRAKERLVLYFIFFLKRRQKDLMPILKISQGRASQLKDESLKQLKEKYLSLTREP